MDVFSDWFVFVRVIGNQGYVSHKVFSLKNIYKHIGISMAYLHVFLIAMYKIDTAAEVYLELFQTYML